MTRSTFQAWRLGLAFMTAAALAACGGGDDPAPASAPTTAGATVALSGTAATGAAIANATVTVVDASGASTTTTTGSDGKFTVQVSTSAPYALKVTDGNGKVWYSYAPAAGTVNITPLTTLAMAQANAGKPLADLVAAWTSQKLDSAAVLEAAKTVNANLQSVMQAKGVSYTSANVFADAFTADGTGLDAVLDSMRVSFTCTATACTQSITTPQGSTLVSWNGNIATTGITLSWSSSGGGGGTVTVGLGSCKAPVKGTYSLVASTQVAGLGAPVPDVCVDGLATKPASQSEFCNASDVQQQLPPNVSILSCSFSGNQGSITARVTSPVTIDYTVTYTYVLN